jgi:hypothetical protein
MFYVDANPENILKLNIANHKKLNNITKVIITKMKVIGESSHEDYFKLKNIVAIYVNEEIKTMHTRDINDIIGDYGFDNAVYCYKKNYRILDNITVRMLIYNIICNTYIMIIDMEKKEAVCKIQSYIVAEKNRKKYMKRVNIMRESDYLIDKVNTEIKCDDAKLILNTIINKFVHRTMKALDKA